MTRMPIRYLLFLMLALRFYRHNVRLHALIDNITGSSGGSTGTRGAPHATSGGGGKLHS
jgi:hypothetical protein